MPTPTVKATVGTFDKSSSKNLALATIVSFAKVLTRVRDTSDEPGSLNAMWPSLPIPVRKKQLGQPSRRVHADIIVYILPD